MKIHSVVRVLRAPAFWVIVSSIVIASFANWSETTMQPAVSWASEGNAAPASDSKAAKESLLREGAQLSDLRGRFRTTNERIVFLEEGTNRTIKVLENLWLQRIMASQKNEDRKVTWLITAKVTEFEGENFLLIELATKTR